MQIVQGFFGRNEDGGLVFFLLFLRADMLLGIFVLSIQQMRKEQKNNY